MVIAVFWFIVGAMLPLWIAVAFGDLPNEILAAPVNHDGALLIHVANQ